VKTGIQTCPCESRERVEETWIPRIKCGAGSAGVYPDGNRGRNDKLKDLQPEFQNLKPFGKSEENRQFSPIIGLIRTAMILNPMMVKGIPKRHRRAEPPFLILRPDFERIFWQTLTCFIALHEKRSFEELD
jgi:hypothetical protein